MKIAVYDIGTNSIHLLIVEVHKDLSFEVLGHEKDTTRLGDGSFESGELSAEAMKKGCEVMERFAKIAARSGVKRSIAVATSAVREARNGGKFIEEVWRRAGLKVSVITGEEEARLIGLAARSATDLGGKKALVIDIGGGSVELILGDGRTMDLMESYKLGVARLSDRFIHEDPPSKRSLKRLESYVERKLRKTLKRVRKAEPAVVLGTAGTMVNLAFMCHYDAQGRTLERVNLSRLKLKDLERVHAKLCRMTLRERMRMPELDPKRADLIVAGSALVLTLMRLLRVSSITISDKGIREGVILDYIDKNKKRLRGNGDGLSLRERSVRQLARRLDAEDAHGDRVAALAERIFDTTQRLHRLGPEEREMLRYAALLHDVGHSISFSKHHKHSYYLIVNSDLDGFTHEEVERLALIARLHRKPVSPKKARRMTSDPEDPVPVLAAMLRIADGLDRSHFGVVKSVSCSIRPGRAIFKLTTDKNKDAELEIWQAKERSDLFEHLYGRPAVFVKARGRKR
ncbi:MAG: Exopolyphosphatase [Candidatus Omnitrophica bacterium]|nr:Exopolyphosphatase [Candidatus Omnitrophota bacterium]